MTQPTYQTGSELGPMPKRKAGSRFTSGHLLMVVSGLLAFLLTIVVLGAKSESITVFVAKGDIVAGTLIDEAQFTPQEIPSSDLDAEYVDKDTLVSGKNYSSRSIAKGEPLMTSALTPEADQNNVRLQSIPVDKTLAVNGDIARGDRVDIIATPDDQCAYRALRNIEVVSVPGSGSSGGVLSNSSGKFTVTVSLSRTGDDLILAGVINTGKYQVIKSTGATSGGSVIEDPQCGTPEAPSDDSDTGGA